MSAIGRQLRSGVTPQQVSGSLFGSGTLSLPVGVLAVTVTGAGAAGGTDYAYNTGQAYSAEVPYTARRVTLNSYGPVYTWAWVSNSYQGTLYSNSLLPLTNPPTDSTSAPPNGSSVLLNGRTLWLTARHEISSGLYLYRAVDVNARGTYIKNTGITEASAGQPYIAPGYYWKDLDTNKPFVYPNPADTEYATCDLRLQELPTALGQSISKPIVTIYTNNTRIGNEEWSATTTTQDMVSMYFAGQAYIPAAYSKPYIAPGESGGPYTGATVSCTLNGITKTWTGGYYTTAPVAATYTLSSTGSGQTLSYTVPTGGQLNYTYEV